MADGISGAIGLITTILQTIQEVQRAQESVRGSEKTLRIIAYQLDSTSKSLILIKDEANLQTPSVQQHLIVMAEIAEELKALFHRLQAIQRQKTMRRFVHAFRSGDDEEKILEAVLHRLDRARNELILRISVAQVGLMGNINEGFRVSVNVLMDMNRKCTKVLGKDLALASQLKGRRPQRDGLIPLDRRDVQRLRLTDPSNMRNFPPQTNIMLNDNITLGRARVVTGNIGSSGWEQMGKKNIAINRNQFSGDLHMLAGDVQGQAATGFFHSKFWD